MRNTVFNDAGVTNIDEFRKLPTSKTSRAFRNAKAALFPGITGTSPTLDFFWGPVLGNALQADHLIYLVRDGKIRPNTPINWNYSKDDSFGFSEEAYNFLRQVFKPTLQHLCCDWLTYENQSKRCSPSTID